MRGPFGLYERKTVRAHHDHGRAARLDGEPLDVLPQLRLEDVLALLCDRGFQAVFSEYNALPPEQRGSLAKAVFQYWFRNSAVLEALVQIHRTDILFDSLRRSSGLIQALQPMVDDPAQFDYFIAIITSSMIGVLTVWVEHGKTETEDQMVQKLTSAFIEMAILELPG